MASNVDWVLHIVASCLFVLALLKWGAPMFLKGSRRVFYAGILVRVLWAAVMSCIISPFTLVMLRIIAIGIFVVLVPFFIEIIVDEIRVVRYWFCKEAPTARIDSVVSWTCVARLKSSNNGYNSKQFYPVTMVDFNERDDPFWPHASTVYMVEIRRRCQVWRTIAIWQVSVLNGGRKKIHTFHDFCRWTDANWFGQRLEIHDSCVNCFRTNGVIFVVVYRCGESNVYIHDIHCGKSSTAVVRDDDIWFPMSICCLGRLVKNDGEVEGWRIRWVAGDWGFKDDFIDCARLIQQVLDIRGSTTCRSQEELMFGRFQNEPLLFPVKTSRGHFGVGAMNANRRRTIVAIYNPVTGKYDRCITELGLQSNIPYWAFRKGQFKLQPMVLSDRECIVCLSDGTVLRAQFATPTLKYRTAKTLFSASPGLQNQMSAEDFRQTSGLDGMGGHFR